MSGLFGYFDPDGELPADTAERMADAMGCPADRSTVILCGRTFALGCVSKGVYPGDGELLSGRNPHRSCLFTGRLLGTAGCRERPDSPALAREVFLDEASPTCLASANGSFAAAVWDEELDQLELVTDRYGIYPLYVAKYRSASLFAGQIKALLAPGLLPVDLDPIAVALMISSGEMVDDLTLVRAVRTLPSGSKTIFSVKGESTTRYWRYAFRESETSFDDTARRLGRLLRNSVERICADSVSVGVPLSGGLDSRVLLAATPNPAKVPSFTWGLAGCRDMRCGAAVARTLGSPHQAFVVDGGYLKRFAPLGTWITEGQLPCTDFHVLPYVENVAEQCDIILNGYAGDALLGGNFIKRPWWRAASHEQAGKELWQWRDARIRKQYRGRILGSTMGASVFDDARAAFINTYLETPGQSPMDAAMAFLLDNRVRRFTSCGTSLMRWRVESEQPFFDNEFLECVSRAPHSWRFRHQLYLQMLRTSFAQAAKVRWERTNLPAGAPRWQMYVSLGIHRLDRYKPFQPLFRSRRGTDFNEWMRGPLRSYVTALLTDSRTLDRGLFDPDTVREIVRDHMESGVDNNALLGSLMTLEQFARLFVDGDAELVQECRVPPPKVRNLSLKVAP